MVYDDVIREAAVTLWHHEAVRAAPNVAKIRNAETWRDVDPREQDRWLQQARAAAPILMEYGARHAAAERAIERAAIVEWLRTDDRFKPYDGAEKSFAFTAALATAIEAGEHLSDNAEAIARGE
jgi:hypothetical protein